MPADVIATARLRLRPLAPGDLGLYSALHTDEEVMRWIAPPLSPAAAARAFDVVLDGIARRRHRYWAIQERGDAAECIGLIAIRHHDGGGEVGIILATRHRRRGIAREAFAALLPRVLGPAGLAFIDAERADDAQAVVIDGLLRPLGFRAVAPTAPGRRRWRRDAGGEARVGSGPRDG